MIIYAKNIAPSLLFLFKLGHEFQNIFYLNLHFFKRSVDNVKNKLYGPF